MNEKIFKIGKDKFIVDLSMSNISTQGADNAVYVSSKHEKLVIDNSANSIDFEGNKKFILDGISYEAKINPQGQHQIKIIQNGRFSGNFPVKYFKGLNHRYILFDFESNRNFLIPVDNIEQYLENVKQVKFVEDEYINAIQEIYKGEELNSYVEAYPGYLAAMQLEFGPLNFDTIDKIVKSERYREVNRNSNNVWSSSLAQYVKTLQQRFGGIDMSKDTGNFNNLKNDNVQNNEEFKSACSTVHNFVTLYIKSTTDITEMVNQINNVSKKQIQDILNQHYSSEELGPVNAIRKQMLQSILTGDLLTVDFVEETISKLKKQNKHNWNHFSLLSGLYYKLFEINLYEEIISQNLKRIVRTSTNLTAYTYTKEFNMMGPRNQGAPYYGYSFLTKQFKANEVNQLVFNIQEDISVYYYDAQSKKREYMTKLDINSKTFEQDVAQAFEATVSSLDKISTPEIELREFIVHTIEDFIEKDYKQLIIDGAPGTGKSYKVNQEVKDNKINHERVTFYQDYEYHNFVGSILPVLNEGVVSYEFIQGPFTKILNDALSMPEDKHYLIIEELTRGNASAIFGDVFQLLDRDEEGFSEYPITHNSILNSLSPEVSSFLQTNYEGKIVLPPNLSIICTINSSDQNVYPLDTAFKRRFDYEIKSTEVEATGFDNFKIHFGKGEDDYAISIDWIKFQKELNNFILIDLKLKEDKQVGPYFIKNHKEDTGKIESIQTKLAMYLWNDLHKVHTISNQAIFNDKVQTLSKVDELFRTGSEESILNILTPEFQKCLIPERE